MKIHVSYTYELDTHELRAFKAYNMISNNSPDLQASLHSYLQEIGTMGVDKQIISEIRDFGRIEKEAVKIRKRIMETKHRRSVML